MLLAYIPVRDASSDITVDAYYTESKTNPDRLPALVDKG